MAFAFNPFTGNFDIVGGVAVPPSSSSPVQAPITFTATCDPSAMLYECVRVMGVDGNGRSYVGPVVPSSIPTARAVGMITSISSPTTCVVTALGIVSIPGLTAGVRYFAGPDAMLTAGMPSVRPFWIQSMGVSLDGVNFLVKPDGTLRGVH